MESMPFVWLIIWLGTPLIVTAFLAMIAGTPDYSRRIAGVVFPVTFCLWALFPYTGVYKLGIDLSGGTTLLYQVKQPAANSSNLDAMVAAIQRRVNPIGMVDVTIRGIGKDRVEIVIPKASTEEIDRYKKLLTDLGTLEFRILANAHDHDWLVKSAKDIFPEPVSLDGEVAARWVPIAEGSRGAFIDDYGEIAIRTSEQNERYVLVVQDPYNVTGDFLRQASTTIDDMAAPAVSFRFNSEGSRRFGDLTGANKPDEDGFVRRLAIMLNGEVYSAPSLQSQIRDQGIITGSFTQQEVDDLVATLNAGSLPGELVKEPISEMTVGPSLGNETIQSGLKAITWASVTVFVFMLIYYGLAGLIANIAVALNIGLVVAIMVWLKGSFTLSGLAGLALTLGMSVDANVLIFERLREEQRAGLPLRTAVRNAFDRAMSPILDSNITTLLTGVVLYEIGTAQIRGFAITLVLGLLANLFTAVFVCRLLFDIIERNRWVSKFGMLSMVGETHWNFMRMRFLAAAGSLLLIAMGTAAVLSQGQNLLDIDFTGGTLAAVRLNQPLGTSDMEQRLSGKLPDVSVVELKMGAEPEGQRYLIRTTAQDQIEVRQQLYESLGKYLSHPTLSVGEFTELAKIGNKATETPAGKQPRKAMQATTFRTGWLVSLRSDAPLSLQRLDKLLENQLSRLGTAAPQTHFVLNGGSFEPQGEDTYTDFELTSDLPADTLRTALAEAATKVSTQPTLERLDSFGSQVAIEARGLAAVALLLSMGVIVIYLWVRFQNFVFGLGAVVALLHDVLVVLGLVAISHWLSGTALGEALLLDRFKIDLPMVAAFLTLVGYSVNDTIVVFDRIRDKRGKFEPLSWSLLNESVNAMFSRTLLTGLTTWLVAVILYVVGGQGIHGFAFVMVAGVIVGTYSSIYIASPVLMWLGGLDEVSESNARRKNPTSSAQPRSEIEPDSEDVVSEQAPASDPGNRQRTPKKKKKKRR